ncbi:hypothetical protein ACGGZK_00080 [Agromyces sp. MMS24-K17]|uniref:hypothetical protein n=1 Tax=Agromyces sp. MMS24-K17 TaxID=3372850 RepID=UPI0037552833
MLVEAVLVGLGVLLLCSAAAWIAFALVVRSVYRRVRRSRAVGGAALRTRARVAHGPQRTVLGLRVRLDDAVRSGQAAVDLAGSGSGPRGELPRLYRRMAEEAATLDLQLRLMESETDASVLAAELPAGRRRVEQVEGLVRRVRSAVASGLSGTTDDALAVLDADVEREVAALRAGIEELRALNRRDVAADPAAAYPAAARPQASAVRTEGNRP